MTTPPDDPRADEGLVEAVAKAIRKAYVKETGGFGKADDRKVAMLCARAALTAARSHGEM